MRPFEFELFRVNLIDTAHLPIFASPMSSDDALLALFDIAVQPGHDLIKANRATLHAWSLRPLQPVVEDVISVILSRSTLQQIGPTVTDSGIETGTSQAVPPLANSVSIFLFLKRHLAAVEYSSLLMTSDQWRRSLHNILDHAARANHLPRLVRFEPVPPENEIMSLFYGMTPLVRLRARLLLPNPELARYTEKLYSELRESGIREYLQDMKNPNGLRKTEGALPFATAALAQSGYKSGEVLMTGVRDGRMQKVITGTTAMRGRVPGLKEDVHALAEHPEIERKQTVLRRILEEVNHIFNPPSREET